MAAKPELTPVTPFCSIERALVLLSDRWSFLVMREILLYGESRFGELQEHLAIASNVLTDRLERLVAGGVLEKRPYRETGSRARSSYHPTRAGLDLKLVLAALQQWGDVHEPRDDGPTVARRRLSDGAPAHVSFVADGAPVSVDEVGFERTAAYPGRP
ncbi:HxlR family transcriptional regulator [Frondihabitans sucicola]|uniref:HxlR family transcriptional regulator n=1 Tax=Frondihabitans sucicola TaxID=1268041 RepID=A0ABM8GJ42_9MICO|nr:helix-turn-helix domain-containing protein [Frondihabitans sucicola]BDZ48398.1 HxlR family transcriptional regulator [Frondihabitans sucicola]